MTTASDRKAETREALVLMAAAMIREGGLARFTLRGLARRKGWSAPSLYEYFSSVEAIIAALKVREEETFYAALKEAASAAPNALEAVKALMSAYIRFFDGRRDRFEIMFEASTTSRASIDAGLPEKSSYGLLLDAMRRRCAEKNCDPARAEDWAFAAWSYAHGVCALKAGFLNPLAEDLAPAITRGIEVIVAGIDAQKSESPRQDGSSAGPIAPQHS